MTNISIGWIFSKLITKREKTERENVLPIEYDYSREIEEEIRQLEKKRLPDFFKSPLDNVSDEDWTSFVKASKKGGNDTITPAYNLGLFHFTQGVLASCGIVSDIVRKDYNGRQVSMGEWVPPYSLELFQKSPSLQYKIFMAISADNAEMVKTMIGKEVEINGEKYITSLSGLLAVSRKAGLGGLDKWLKGDRMDYTSRLFVEANGLF
jgi:hypothetical protein